MQTDISAAGVFSACPDGLMILDGETGTITAANERCGDLCGRSPTALRGRALSELAPDDWTPPTPLGSLLAQARDDRVTFDWRVDRPDGTAAILECAMARTEQHGDGRLLVTVRERPSPAGADAAESPACAEREMQELIDAMNDTVFVVDLDGDFVDANQVAVERLGYSRSELLAMGPADISPPAHAEQVGERLRTIDDNETHVFESVQVTADGEEIPVEINARRITYRGDPAVLSVARDITDRKERTRKLRTFEQAVEQAGHAVYITDPDGTIAYVNPAFEEITGYGQADALGETPKILSSGEMPDRYYDALWETLLAGDVWEEEIENERADGERYYAEQTIAPIVDGGEVVNFVAIQQDVTERKRREQELERYQQLIENVPVGVYRNTPGLTGKFEEVNPAMVDMFGAEDEAELLDTHVAALYRTPSQREIFSRKLEAEQQVVEEELRLETRDGELFWGAVTAIRHEIDGEVYYDGIVQDVTERREKARELRLRERRFRRLFENHNAPMLLIDPDTGSIERANDAAVEFYGYEKQALTSMAIQDINQLSDEAVARRRAAAEEEETNRFIFPHELADGDVRQVEVDSTPITAGGQRLLFSIIHDVTERERTRERLERQNERLELLNRVVRHDIRNDMSVIISYADLLEDHVDDEGAAYLETVVEHGEHVVELTSTVRKLMEAMLGEDDDGPGTVVLSRVLDAEIEEVGSVADRVEIDVERPLPDIDVVGNEMLSSVFRNILNNAIQHNDVDAPRVDIAVEETADTVEVRIADNGPGIPDDQKAEVFGKGEHGMDSPGTGLGLYLVHTFVDQFGGDVWVTDHDGGGGAVFHVELPRADADTQC